MGLLAVGLGALALGALLAFLLAAAPRPAPAKAAAVGGPDAPLGWLAALSAEELGRLLLALLRELGFSVEPFRVVGEVVELLARNPAPLVGGRVYVRGLSRWAGEVGEDEVRVALDLGRAEQVGKVLLVTGTSFAPGARALAADLPIELVDGAALLALVRSHLPEYAAAGRAPS